MNPLRFKESKVSSAFCFEEPKKDEAGQSKLKKASSILEHPPAKNDQKLDKRAISAKREEKSTSNLPDTVKKAVEKEKKSAGWLYYYAPNAVLKAAVKVGEKVLFNIGALKKARKESKEQLEKLTQSAELSLFLGAISPIIVKIVQENATDDERLKNLLSDEDKFLTDLIDSLLPKIFINIVKSKGETPPITMASILSFVVGIASKHLVNIHSQIAQVEAQKDPIKRKKELRKLFDPMIDELLAIALPNGEKDLPLVSVVRDYVWNYLKNEVLPDVLLSFYHSFMDPREHSKMDQLRQMRGGNFLATLCEAAGDKITTLAPRLLMDQAEGITENVISQFPTIDELSTVFQAEIRQRILHRTDERSVRHEDLEDEWDSIALDLQSWLETQVIQIGKCQDPALQSLWKFIGEGIKPILAHLVLNLAEGSEGEDIFHTAIKKLLAEIGDFIVENGKEIYEAYTLLQKNGLDPVQDENFIALFRPLSSKIFQMVGMDKEDDRPTPAIFGPQFWVNIENKHLPQLLIHLYINTSSWQNQVEEYQAEIREITHTNYVPESCHVLAQWVSDLLPAKLALESHALAENIYELAKDHLEGSPNQSIDEFLQIHEEEIKKLISQNILNLATDLGEENPAIGTAKGYLEALFLKVFDHLTIHIHSIEDSKGENYQEEFLVKTALNLLHVINQHFCKINEVRRDHNKSTANRIDPETMIQAFGEALHPAIPKELSEERKIIRQAQKLIDAERKKISETTKPERIKVSREKIKEAQVKLNQAKAKIDEYRLKNHFVPFVNDLLKTLNLENPSDLPMPGAVWKTFCQEVVPRLALEIFDEITKPSRRNEFLLMALESFEEALDATPCDLEEEAKYEDDTQKDLDKACGELVLQLLQMVPVRLLPEAITKVIFRLTKVKDISGEKIGRALRTKLGKEWSTIKILDEAMLRGMPSLYPGTWEGDRPEEMQFVPKKTSIDQDEQALESEGWQSDFPRNEEEKEIQSQLQWEKEQVLTTALKKKMIKVPQKAISFSLKGLITGPWNRFHKTVNHLISDHLGMTPLIAKQFCDYVCHKIFFTFLGGILSILSFPIRETISLIAELYLRLKLRHIYQTVQMEIHDNLYYRLGDSLKDALDIRRQDAADNLITQLIETAIRRNETFPK